MRASSASMPLAFQLWPVEKGGFLGRGLLLAALGVCLLTAGAKIQVPMWPVPMTMQTFAVLLIGAAYGPALGAGTVLAYLGAGAAGLPVFAGPAAGTAYFLGPTAGYFAGWLFGVVAMGWLAARFGAISGWRLAAVLTVGTVSFFVFGVARLAFFVPPEAGDALGLEQAFATGLVPFIPGAVVKLGLAYVVLEGLRRLDRAQ